MNQLDEPDRTVEAESPIETPRAVGSKAEAIAFHTAGEAVALSALGYDLRSVTIDSADGYPGVVTPIYPPLDGDEATTRDRICAMFVGTFAEQKYFREQAFIAFFNRDKFLADQKTAAELAGKLSIPAEPLIDKEVKRSRILGRRHWQAICLIARALLRERTIRGVDLAETVAGYAPKRWKSAPRTKPTPDRRSSPTA